MKKAFLGLLMAMLASCEYNDLQLKTCYLAMEETLVSNVLYTYNDHNQIVSYSSPTVYSTALTYDNGGKIISEIDDDIFQITYDYDDQNRLIQWSEVVQGSPGASIQSKFFYNALDQDTLIQYFKYHSSTSSYYLWRYSRLDFADHKNYSRVRTYDAATNTLLSTEEFLWDNHPNPYLANAFFLNSPPPTNNVTEYTITVPGYGSQTTDYTYTYNSNGFPVEKRVPSYSVPVSRYTYANCH